MITSSMNTKIKNIIQLDTYSKARREQKLFVAEGIKMFIEAPEKEIRQVFVSESYYAECPYKDRIHRLSYEIVEDGVFKKAADTMTPQGILCLVEQKQYLLEDLLAAEAPLLMILEGLQDPGNLGTILRTGEGAGINGVIMDRKTVDIYNPKVIRATMGSVYRVPFVYTDELPKVIEQIRQHGITLYAAHLKGSDRYDFADYSKGSAFMIGNEGNGLSNDITRMADQLIRIPMQGQVESLNAAVSAGVLMYEASRQRAGK